MINYSSLNLNNYGLSNNNVTNEMFVTYADTGDCIDIINNNTRFSVNSRNFISGIVSFRIEIQFQHYNNMEIFNNDILLTERKFDSKSLLCYNHIFDIQKLSIYGKILFTRILQIHGVTSVRCLNNIIEVYFCNLFTYEEIKQNVINFIRGRKFSSYDNISSNIKTSFFPQQSHWNAVSSILMSRIKLTQYISPSEVYISEAPGYGRWNDFNFDNLTRKGKKFISLFKRVFNKDFRRLHFCDHRMFFIPSNDCNITSFYENIQHVFEGVVNQIDS